MTTIEAVPATPQPSSAPAPQPFAVANREPVQSTPAPAKAPRLVSLDVFRGITIAAMVLVNNQPEPAYWPFIHAGEQGPKWNGWTPTDLIFPFFLFIVGVATPFSLGKRAGKNETRGNLLAHIWARALSLFMLGELATAGTPFREFSPVPDGFHWITGMRIAVTAFAVLGTLLLLFPWKSRRMSLGLPVVMFFLYYLVAIAVHLIIKHTSGLPEHFSFGNGLLNPLHLRIPGVLQRIGICYGVAATLGLFFGWQMVLFWAVALLVLYSGLMLKMPFGNDHVIGSLSKSDNLARRIDEWLLIRQGRWNHAYSYPDNEGALSTLPAIAEVLFGILAGVWLRTFRPAAERGMGLLVFGLFTLLVGLGLNKWLMPINKEIWTPTFTVFTTGMALLCFGTVFYFVDVLGRRAWALPFKIYGMNAIAAFVGSGLVLRLALFLQIKHKGETLSAWSWYQRGVYAGMDYVTTGLTHISPKLAAFNIGENRSLVFALSYVVLICLLMSILYVCKIFVKV